MGVEDRGAEERGKGRTRPPGAGPLHQIEIDDFRRDRLLAALTLILGAAFCLGLPFALQAGAEFFLPLTRSEEHTSELQSLMRISYAVFCLNKQKTYHAMQTTIAHT